MKRLIGLLALSIALPALAALDAGDTAPDFKAPASLDGKVFEFSLKESLAKGPVVVYFYPSAFTGGCSLQAHTFAVNYDKFAAAGASIIGVSLDNIERLKFIADTDGIAPAGGRAALRSSSKDRFPIIGALTENVYVSTAHGSHGLVSTLAGAHLLADNITGGPRSLPRAAIAALAPDRFAKREARKTRRAS